MESYVGIAVSQQSTVMGYIYTAKPQLSVCGKCVYVKSLSYADGWSFHMWKGIVRLSFSEETFKTVHVKCE